MEMETLHYRLTDDRKKPVKRLLKLTLAILSCSILAVMLNRDSEVGSGSGAPEELINNI